ncbi:MAG: 4-hydroxythreonine-4-phosphate dehydrogenase PdxA [Bacteroidetes bacterium SB0662_bin_6]|nr:4-hydroxythreonine-4-phosphate dehydrogenase PdxA [Bacteroidetes bacterium SB0668_bin_1]MYE04820.1 4-hydroxythreonine-4-phosphate dehydrogenase PdxA [Bacteroidetes bacterium SB0662_bin_6]
MASGAEPVQAPTDASARTGGRLERPRVAVTLGDPNGIGPEVVLKSVRETHRLQIAQPVIVGSAQVLRAHAARMGNSLPDIRIVTSMPDRISPEGLFVLDIAQDEPFEPEFGKVAAEAGALAMRSVERAVAMCIAGEVDAVVTAPVHKEAISMAGYMHPGHTEFIAGLAGCSRYAMMMIAEGLRVGLVTAHMPLRDVPHAVTRKSVLAGIRVVHAALRVDFGIQSPEIAVLGLNPHAGEGGVLGREETEVVGPAIHEARAGGLLASGPHPADGFFGAGAWRRYDAVLAMYHDQGLAPFKTLAFEHGVNYTAGLPIVRTSPDHGTAFDIAGQGRARSESMLSAIRLAVDIVRCRNRT